MVELQTYGSHFPSRGLAETSRCLFRTLPVSTGRSADFKTRRPDAFGGTGTRPVQVGVLSHSRRLKTLFRSRLKQP